MARGFVINGETLVAVAGNLVPLAGPIFVELGLAQDAVRVVPRFYHEDLYVDDFGPRVPAEVMHMLVDINVYMTLVHYDNAVLNACVRESMAGSIDNPAGVPMGRGQPLYGPGNHYMTLVLFSPVLGQPWVLNTCYLTGQPLEIPLGTSRTLASLAWRAIPYAVPTRPPGSTSTTTAGFEPGFELKPAAPFILPTNAQLDAGDVGDITLPGSLEPNLPVGD